MQLVIKNMKKRLFLNFFLIILFYAVIFGNAKADVFVLNFNYDFNKNILNFSDQEKVVLDKENNIPILEFITGKRQTGDYVIRVFDIKDYELFDAEFQPKNGLFQLSIPYASTAKYLKIYIKNSNQEILNADLSQFITCNSNGICELEKKENIDTCVADCANSNVKFSQQTKEILDKSGGILKDEKTGAILLKGNTSEEQIAEKKIMNDSNQDSKNRMWSIILIIIMSSAVAVLIYFIIRKKIIKK